MRRKKVILIPIVVLVWLGVVWFRFYVYGIHFLPAPFCANAATGYDYSSLDPGAEIFSSGNQLAKFLYNSGWNVKVMTIVQKVPNDLDYKTDLVEYNPNGDKEIGYITATRRRWRGLSLVTEEVVLSESGEILDNCGGNDAFNNRCNRHLMWWHVKNGGERFTNKVLYEEFIHQLNDNLGTKLEIKPYYFSPTCE